MRSFLHAVFFIDRLVHPGDVLFKFTVHVGALIWPGFVKFRHFGPLARNGKIAGFGHIVGPSWLQEGYPHVAHVCFMSTNALCSSVLADMASFVRISSFWRQAKQAKNPENWLKMGQYKLKPRGFLLEYIGLH